MNRNINALMAYAILPAVLGISYVFKAFLMEGCYAFETNDEVAHTFLEIDRAWRLIREGSLPLMNLFNNFGTPLLGDPVVNPFALHTIPYLLLPGPAAATLNRALIIALTVSVLTLLYRRCFSRSLLASVVSAVLVVMLPAFSHFSVHHPHQGVVLYFSLILIMQQALTDRPSLKTLTGLYASLLFFALGVGLNPFFFAWPFLLLHQVILSGNRIDRAFILFGLLAAATFILLYPHWSSFFQYSALTSRAALDYPKLLPFTLKRLLMDVLFFRTQTILIHVSDAMYYSLPVLFLAASGIHSCKDHRDRLRMGILGFAPFLGVVFLLVLGDLRSTVLPFLKPVDISRFLWFGNIFIAAAVAYALDGIQENRHSEGVKTGLLAMLPFSLVKIFAAAITGTLILAGALWASRTVLVRWSREKALEFDLFQAWFFSRRNPTFLLLVTVCSLFFSFLPVYIHYSGLERNLDSCDGFGYANAYYAEFHPEDYLQVMKPFERYATQFEPTTYAYLMQATRHDRFGSDGRSIILHGGLKQYLQDRDLVDLGWYGMTYAFTSTDARELGRLGIRYVVAGRTDGFREADWEKPALPNPQTIQAYGGKTRQAHLYRARDEVSVCYLARGEDIRYVHDLVFRGSEIRVNLPHIREEADLVLAFVRWPGWEVQINGKPGKLQDSDAHFLRTAVKPGDRAVVFEFRPFSAGEVVGFAAASLLLFGMSLVLFAALRRRPSAQPDGRQGTPTP